MTTTQTSLGLSADNPSSVNSLEQLNSSTQSTATTFVQQPNESTKNTPLNSSDVSNVLNAVGVSTNGVVAQKSLPFITVKTTQKLVTSVSGSGVPTAKPVVVNNKNVTLQPGLGIDAVADVIIPFARSASIKFQANKLKPNTRYYAFFNEYDVTEYCFTGNNTSNVSGFSTTTMTSKLESQKLANVAAGFAANVIVAETGNIFSDYKGFVSGVFMFEPSIGLKIPSGDIIFRLTDSSTNSEDRESYADAVYSSIGRLVKVAKPAPKPTTKKPTYGTGGKKPGLPTPGNGNTGNGSSSNDYGWLDHHIAYLKNIPLSAITNQMRLDAYKDYVQSNGGSVIADSNLMKTIVPGVVDYDLNGLVDSGFYNWVTGNSATDKNKKLSNGARIGDFKTGVNILEAVNSSTGKTFVQEAEAKIKSVGGDTAWKMTVAEYEGTVKQVQKAVSSNKLTPDMKAFWETGVATGKFNPNKPEDIQKAINNYAASVTLGMLTQKSTASKAASKSTQTNGTVPALKSATSNNKNSVKTSTGKKT